MLERAFTPSETEDTFSISLEGLTADERQTVLRACDIWDRFVAIPQKDWDPLYDTLTKEQKRDWQDAVELTLGDLDDGSPSSRPKGDLH